MPRKTLKQKRRRHRTLRTLRRVKRRGGALEGQALAIPSAGFKNPGAPVNSADPWYNK